MVFISEKILNNFVKKDQMKILMIGIGGGSDIILSAILMKKIKSEFNNFYDKNKKIEFYLVNSKSTYPKLNDVIEVLPNFYKVNSKKVNLTPDIETHGTLLLEQFVRKLLKMMFI